MREKREEIDKVKKMWMRENQKKVKYRKEEGRNKKKNWEIREDEKERKKEKRMGEKEIEEDERKTDWRGWERNR